MCSVRPIVEGSISFARRYPRRQNWRSAAHVIAWQDAVSLLSRHRGRPTIRWNAVRLARSLRHGWRLIILRRSRRRARQSGQLIVHVVRVRIEMGVKARLKRVHSGRRKRRLLTVHPVLVAIRMVFVFGRCGWHVGWQVGRQSHWRGHVERVPRRFELVFAVAAACRTLVQIVCACQIECCFRFAGFDLLRNRRRRSRRYRFDDLWLLQRR